MINLVKNLLHVSIKSSIRHIKVFKMSKDIVIRIMTLEDYPLVQKLLRDSFKTGEPTLMCSNEDPEKYAEKDIEDYNLFLIGCGSSLIALQNDKVIGAVLAGPQLSTDIEKHYKEAQLAPPNVWGRIQRFVAKLEKDANVYERYNITKYLYSHMTCVDRSMRGKGMGNLLVKRLMELGREQGYPLIVANCTSFYSARQKEALGWKCIYALNYSDYKDESGNVIFNTPEPHKQARVVVLKL